MIDSRLFDLFRIGLTEGESKVYLALLELGSSTVGPIVKKAGVAYSNIYDILNRLIEKGVVSYIIRNKTKYFQAAGPSNLYDYLERKELELKHQKEMLTTLLPSLKKLQHMLPQPEAEIFIGKKGLKAAYEKLFEALNKKDIFCFFYIHREVYGEEADRFYWSAFGSFVKHNSVRTLGIANEEYRKSWFVKNMKRFNMTMRYVPYPTAGNIDIYQDKILLVSWLPEPIGFLIKSKSITDDFRTYFFEVWKTAKP